jgi:hypothetical protein
MHFIKYAHHVTNQYAIFVVKIIYHCAKDVIYLQNVPCVAHTMIIIIVLILIEFCVYRVIHGDW